MTLREAVRSGGMPTSRVFNALWQLEKQQLVVRIPTLALPPAQHITGRFSTLQNGQEEAWSERISSGKGGTRWRIAFVASEEPCTTYSPKSAASTAR